ncbi:response regulator [Desulfosarcina sp.]|uniref:response regulator n=1 Tax=Desulfosarcina sp. TaxID=2027861 RepID=UPI003970598A
MSKTSILIVEDEGIVAENLSSKLEQLGYAVAGTAATSIEAIEVALRLRPQLILMDIQLNGQDDGIQAAETIRAKYDVPVIYLTAHSDPATLSRAKLTGPFGYILKPFEMRDLATQIDLALYKHQADMQVQEQREWLRVTLTSIGDAVIATDAQEHITFMNPVAESLIGLKVEEAINQPLSQVFRIINKQTGQSMEDPVACVLRECRTIPLANHTALVTKDGCIVPIEDSASPILDAKGRVIGAVLVFHDVTEKRRTEEALKHSRLLMSEAERLSHTGAWEWDLISDRWTFSDEWLSIHGCPSRTLTPDELISIAHPEDRAVVEQAFANVRKGKAPYDLEHRIVRLDNGKERIIHGHGRCITDAEGRPAKVYGFAQDITERKQAEQARLASEQRFHDLFTNMNEGFALGQALLDTNGGACDFCFLVMNEAFEQQSGLSRQIIGRPMTEVLPNLEQNWIDTYCGVAITGESVHFQNYNQDTGRHYDVMCYSPSKGSFAILFLDITEQVKNEQLLRQMNERLQQQTEALQAQSKDLSAANKKLQRAHGLIEGITRGTSDLIAAQDKDFRYIYFNEAYRREFTKLWGLEIEIGTNMAEALSPWPEDQRKACDLWGRALQGESFGITEKFGPEPENQVYQLQFNPIYDAQGLQIGAAHINRNVTEQVRVQEALRKNISEREKAEEKLRNLNETLEQKVTERTLLAENRSRQLQALAAELIEAEERERRRIADLLHDDLQQMLAAARMQLESACQSQPNEPNLTNVKQLLEESILKSRRLSHELSPPVLQHSNLTAALQWISRYFSEHFGLQVELQLEEAHHLEGDQNKVFLFRAVQELLFNVVKHSGVKRAGITFSTSNGCLAVIVSDQGRGFNPDLLDSATASAGLGLLSLRERARYIGGSLAIESAPGLGSRFTLSVPLDLSKTDKAQRPDANLQPIALTEGICRVESGTTRVLFVDDHKVMRQGLINLIGTQPGIHVAGEASNGKEAIDRVRQLKPDVVVMDVSMPEMDGIEATRHIKAQWPEVRVIALSMVEDEHVSRTMREAGAEAFVSKTASSAELLKAIFGSNRKQSEQ